MRLILVLVALFCLIAKELAAQSIVKIHGFVSSATGEPLEGANVTVVGTGYGAATNATGYYAIENLFAAEYTVRASYLGYREATQAGVVVSKEFPAKVDFRLQPSTIRVGEVVIEAELIREKSTLFREWIDRQEIERSSARTVGELLVSVPGLQVTETGAGEKQITVRGSQANQVLVLIDGVTVNDPLLGYQDLNEIPLAWVEKIRIWKGGSSHQFGSGALGGVVEIFSRHRAIEEMRLTGDYGDFGAFGVQPALSGQFRKIGYFLNYHHLEEKGDYDYTYHLLDGNRVSDTRLNADFSSNSYFGKVIFENNEHRIELQSSLRRSNRGLPGLVFSLSPFARAESNRRILIAKYRLKLGNSDVRLQGSQHLNESRFENFPPADAPPRFRTVPAYHSQFRVLTYLANFQLTSKLFGKHGFDLNTSLRHDDFNEIDLLTGLAGPVKQTKNLSYSAAVRNDWLLPAPGFVGQAFLKSSLRFDSISFKNLGASRQDFHISPWAGLLISRNRTWNLNLEVNWGRSFRAPTFADLFFQDFRIRGNPDLKPEKSRDFNAGLDLGMPLLGWIELEGAYFRQKVENQIVWELGSFATFQPTNTDALSRGWEFGGSWRTGSEVVNLSWGHTILNSVSKSGDRTTHNKQLAYRPEHTTKLTFRLNAGPVSATYQRRWVGERFVTAANTVKMPAYSADDLTMAATRKLGNLEIQVKLAVMNLSNQRYEILENAPLPGRHGRLALTLIH